MLEIIFYIIGIVIFFLVWVCFIAFIQDIHCQDCKRKKECEQHVLKNGSTLCDKDRLQMTPLNHNNNIF